MRNISGLLSGVIFGLGLAISGMIDPNKVIGFLDITGNWDPSLAFVMGAAVVVTAISFRLVLRRPAPMLGGTFQVPTKQDPDKPVIIGAALFGIGWGLTGLCPGPAFSSLALFDPKILAFVLAMLVGAVLDKQTFFNPFVDRHLGNGVRED